MCPEMRCGQGQDQKEGQQPAPERHGQRRHVRPDAAPDNHIPELHRKLAAAGLLFPDWPVEWGGSAAPAFATSAVHRALSRAGWPISVLVVSDSIGKLLMLFGTDEAKAEILPRLARGEALACLGLSEPSGGSDVFGAKTRVRHDGTRWLADGQKVFTTSAHIAVDRRARTRRSSRSEHRR